MTQYRQIHLFRCSQKVLYEKFVGKRRETSDPPQGNNARKFWNEICDKPV